jgi:hypothetical protein
MKNCIGSVIVLVLLGVGVFAQNRATERERLSDFNGTWIIDDDWKNTRGEQVWVISFADGEFSLSKTFSANGRSSDSRLILFTDRRGETNKIYSMADRHWERNSTTYIKDGKIVSEYAAFSAAPGDVLRSSYTVIERYSLSKDRSKLIFTQERRLPVEIRPRTPGILPEPNFTKEFKIVFRRKA